MYNGAARRGFINFMKAMEDRCCTNKISFNLVLPSLLTHAITAAPFEKTPRATLLYRDTSGRIHTHLHLPYFDAVLVLAAALMGVSTCQRSPG